MLLTDAVLLALARTVAYYADPCEAMRCRWCGARSVLSEAGWRFACAYDDAGRYVVSSPSCPPPSYNAAEEAMPDLSDVPEAPGWA